MPACFSDLDGQKQRIQNTQTNSANPELTCVDLPEWGRRCGSTEVTMKPARIDAEAAKVLAEWKSLFAAEVCERAKRLAAQSGHPDSVTLSHYRMAAKMALQVLAVAIQGEQKSHGEQEAA
jgi:hypothetical protein